MEVLAMITIRVKGYAGPGWEIECTGSRKWVEKTLKKFIPKVKKIALYYEPRTQ